jgi:hypothetical protein
MHRAAAALALFTVAASELRLGPVAFVAAPDLKVGPTLSVATLALAAVGPTFRSGAAAQTPRDAAVPFKVGETLTYDVTWSTLLIAGSATSRIVERESASRSDAYEIVADGRPIPLLQRLYNLYYRLDTRLDTRTLLPHRATFRSEENGARRQAETRFDRERGKASFELDEDGTDYQYDFDVPPQVQDALSAVYVLRAMPWKPGDRLTVPVSNDGALFSVIAEPAAAESVRVPFGALEGWRVHVTVTDAQGQPAVSDAAVWISTDSRRLPLKLQAKLPVGHFVLVLRDAR